MEDFVKGDVVVIPFPFSDLTNVKRRPALVVSKPDGSDLILCQITSKIKNDSYSLPIVEGDFETGGLKLDSNVRPNRLFTADRGIIIYRIGRLKRGKMGQIVEKAVDIIRNS